MKKLVILGTIVAAAGVVTAVIVFFYRLGEQLNVFFTDMENTGYDC